ncbi:MAG: hypothetical protein JW775_04310 [Candidatus Aminicenantes bacterium]|nr:hypothetical protein [Candidatus Aminicenantes bacterium]
MTRRLSKVPTALLALACLAVPIFAQAPAQDAPVDMKRLIAEIVGEYEFSADGQVLVVQFAEVDGKLFGAPPGETLEEIHPVADKPLCFDITLAQTGDYYELQFVRNAEGVIDSCVMTVMGMVIQGYKIKR